MVQIILLERVAKLGAIGDVVTVKPGYARNFLLPRGKALRATTNNQKVFEERKAQLELENAQKRDLAQLESGRLDGMTLIVIRQAGESGHLYGSVTARDVVQALNEKSFTVDHHAIIIGKPIKTIGRHAVQVALHPEVVATITIHIAKSMDEALNQTKQLDQQEAEETFPQDHIDTQTDSDAA